MNAAEHESDLNLENLRSQLTGRIALLLVGFGLTLMWVVLPWEPFSLPACAFLGVLPALGGAARLLQRRWPILARHLLVWGLSAWLIAALALYNIPWLPLLGLVLSFIGALLVSGGEVITPGAVMATMWWLVRSGVRAYPLPQFLAALLFGAGLAWLTVRTLYTALEWAWTMQQRADQLLEMARDRQGNLNKALRSLDLSNSLLRRTQNELIAARQQAEEARLMKERFAASVSHELRTPLSIILGFSEMIYISPEVYGEMEWPPKLRRAVYQIYRNSRHLLEMIDDVLDLSRLGMAGFTLELEETSLDALVDEAAGIAADLFQGRPVRLEVAVEPGLPTLRLDRVRMRQVLLNLLSNAARFTERGVVRIAARQAEDEVVVSVSDTGTGIPSDRLPLVFREFYQADNSLRRTPGGFGLGLSICKRFVEAHDGRIWAESEMGRGSTLHFALPLPGHHAALPRLQVDRPLQPLPAASRPAVLMVDADSVVTALVRRHIEDYDIIEVEDSEDLSKQVALHHPRAIIRNVVPGQVTRFEPSLSDPVPVIECSLPGENWMADQLGVVACLTKPVAVSRLLQEIARLGDVNDVLIVDDDRGFCELVEQLLEGTGRDFALRHAFDGADGLRAVAWRPPDLVLLDLVMPGVDGFQMLEELRQRPETAGIPVVSLTANSFADDALAQLGSQILIRRAGGLSVVDTLRCLRAAMGSLEPTYVERAGGPAE